MIINSFCALRWVLHRNQLQPLDEAFGNVYRGRHRFRVAARGLRFLAVAAEHRPSRERQGPRCNCCGRPRAKAELAANPAAELGSRKRFGGQ